MYHITAWLRILRIPLLLLFPAISFSQSLTLDEAYNEARLNYPLIKQKDLINRTAALNISNLNKNFLPQLLMTGQASYQSDVTKVEAPFPGFVIQALSKDQYKMLADISQLVYDGGVTRQQKTLQQLNASVNDQQLEVELYKLRERVNLVYLGVLLFDEQIKQVRLVQDDIATGIKKVEAQIKNGVAFKSNLSLLQAEMIKYDQRIIELGSSRKNLLETLELFIGKDLNDSIKLTIPKYTVSVVNINDREALADSIVRPEMTLFRNQAEALGHQNKLITARNLPKTSLFFQGGYGRPGLNLLKNEFAPYYIGGVRLNWSLGNLYTTKNDRQLIRVNQDFVNTQRETFLLNTTTEINKQENEIQKLNELIDSDNEIIALRKSVTDASKAQLENGVITASDYLIEVNAENQARQEQILHRIQLIQAQLNYKTTIGN